MRLHPLMALALAFSCSALPAAAQEMTQGPLIIAETTVAANAEVIGVDKASRTITIKDEKGETRKLKLGERVKNFDQIKKGDRIQAEYFDSVALAIQPEGGQPGISQSRSVQVARPGEKPGGVVTDTTQVSATVESVDPAKRTVTLKGPEGNVRTFELGEQVADIGRLQPGQEVVVTQTEAVAIDVTK